MEVCEALGLDASEVVELNIYIGLSPPVEVTVQKAIWDDDQKDVVKVLHRYDLHIEPRADNPKGVD